jgi:DNA-binding transcriptional MocR family regulator
VQLLLDREAEVPLHRQIADQIRGLIESGDLPIGTRLPATRGLAQRLGVNRATVSSAYDALAAAGLVVARVGQGTRVVSRGGPEDRPLASSAPRERRGWSSRLAMANEALMPPSETAAGPGARDEGGIDFTGVIPDERFFPIDRLRRCLDDVLRRDGERLLQYGSTQGYEPFRDMIAQRMRLAGTPVNADEILVVNGAQQGLDLFCKAFLDPGDAVVVESPTYGNLLALLRLYRAEVIPIPMTHEGIDLEELEATLARRPVKFLYTMPHFQNPTGITTSLEARQRLLTITSTQQVVILEDGFEEELRWDGGEVLPLRALDQEGRVCYVGTFSKGLCPGFRIGWLVADSELVSRLAHLKRTTDFHSSVLMQAALTEFCHRGEYDKHLQRLRKVYRQRMARTAEALAASMPEDCRWRIPAGGYCVWLELPPGVSDAELAARAARDGVHVTPGRHFFVHAPAFASVRLSISRVDDDEIDRGLQILGRHLHRLAGEVRGRGRVEDARPYV